jgi:phosphonate transport system substrate-binding protein
VVVNTAIFAQNFDDIRGTIHAFSDPDSTSGYLITRYVLALRKTIPAERASSSSRMRCQGGAKFGR